MSIVPLQSVALGLSDEPWEFAASHRDEIDRHWRRRVAAQPRLFNGEVVLLRRWQVEGGRFAGTCIRTDFKSFLYWRDSDAPDRSVADFFAAGAVHSSEGFLILGRAGPAMSNCGKIYPPSGSLHLDPERPDAIDLDEAIIRELAEETGIRVTAHQLGPLLLIEAPPQVVVIRPIRLARSAAELVAAIERHVHDSPEAELDAVIVVRGIGDIVPDAMPPFTIGYIEWAFGAHTAPSGG